MARAEARRDRRDAADRGDGGDDGRRGHLPEGDERFARISKALGHPLRTRIVGYLAKQEECIVGELAGRFGVAQSTMSEHLRVLRKADVVQGILEGPRTCYCLDPETLAWFDAEVERRLGSFARGAGVAPRRKRLARA